MATSISLNNLGKKFNKEWIFRNLSYDVKDGEKLVILGGNGSGKSTLLQVISTFVTPNEGTVSFMKDGEKTEPDKVKNLVSFCSPYLQLIEDFTLGEMVEQAEIFKPFLRNISTKEFTAIVELEHVKNKLIKQFSSGMKQRLKLGLAILANTPVLLLDEPVSNLDKNAIAWYKQLISNYTKERTVIVCSNAITEEYFFCGTELNVMDYKMTGGSR